VTGTQTTFLTAAAELATTKVVLQQAFALLGMRLDQHPVLGEPRMTGADQKRQRFMAIWIMFDLIGLRVRRWNHLVSFEMVMDNSLPSLNLALTELWHTSCARVTTFNSQERFFRPKLFTRRHVDPVVMCNLAEIVAEHADR